MEHRSKNNAGGIAEQNLTVKNVNINSVPDSARCHVRICREYLKRVPPEAIRSNKQFYLQPVLSDRPLHSQQYWFLPKPIGEKRIKNMVSDMFSDVGIDGHFTNHSLRATRASELFATGVPEALIQKRTGHCSVESLRLYETRGVQDELNQTISNILAGKSNSFTNEYQHVRHASRSQGEPSINVPQCNDSGFVDDLNTSDEEFIDKYVTSLNFDFAESNSPFE